MDKAEQRARDVIAECVVALDEAILATKRGIKWINDALSEVDGQVEVLESEIDAQLAKLQEIAGSEPDSDSGHAMHWMGAEAEASVALDGDTQSGPAAK